MVVAQSGGGDVGEGVGLALQAAPGVVSTSTKNWFSRHFAAKVIALASFRFVDRRLSEEAANRERPVTFTDDNSPESNRS
jgi:hypothetical protein